MHVPLTLIIDILGILGILMYSYYFHINHFDDFNMKITLITNEATDYFYLERNLNELYILT